MTPSFRFIATLGLAVLFVGCAGSGKPKYRPDATAIGEFLEVAGTLDRFGSTPFTDLILTAPHTEVMIDRGSATYGQLEALTEMQVLVRGEIIATDQVVTLNVHDFDLLALPNGDVPVLGMLGEEQGKLVLTHRVGDRYWLRGDLADALRSHVGLIVWVIGEQGDAALPDKPKKSVPFKVTGYGVVR